MNSPNTIDAAMHRLVMLRGIVTLAALFMAVMTVGASAQSPGADYRVAFGIRSDHGEEVGLLNNCRFGQECEYDAKVIRYRIRVFISRPTSTTAHVDLRWEQGRVEFYFDSTIGGNNVSIYSKSNAAGYSFYTEPNNQSTGFIKPVMKKRKPVGQIYLYFPDARSPE